MPSTLQERTRGVAVPTSANPRTGADLFSTQQVRDIATTTTGRVRLTLLLGAQDDPALAKEVRAGGRATCEGVTDVRARRAGRGARPQDAAAAGRALPVMDQAPAAPARPAAPTPKHYPNLGADHRRVVAGRAASASPPSR